MWLYKPSFFLSLRNQKPKYRRRRISKQKHKMDAKTVTPAGRVYLDFEPSVEWVWEEKWATLLLYLPGFTKDQLRVQVTTSGVLKLSGERPIEGETRNRFYKEVQIPKTCDLNAISARFENSILYVQLPKIINAPPQQDTEKPQTLPPKPEKPANQPEPQKEPAKEPQKPVNKPLSGKAPQPQMPMSEPHSQGEPLKEAPKQKPADEPYTPGDQKTKPNTKSSENTSPADGKKGVFTETNNVPKKTSEKGGDEPGKDTKEMRGASEQQGNIGDSAEKATKLDQEAPSNSNGSDKTTFENYTKVVGSLARDLRQGGKLFNLVLTVLLALLLGLYFGNMIKSSEKPKI